MVDNVEITADGKIEVYLHRVFELADEYIEKQLDGDKEQVKDYFPDMLMYIADGIEKPPNEDIKLLDKLFSIYVKLCTKNKQLPTLEAFSWLVKINRSTFTDWSNGEYRNKVYYTADGKVIDNINTWRFNHRGEEYREVSSTTYSDTVKKWFDICKSFAVNKLINKGGVDANLIFACKAAYGMAETSPVPIEDAVSKRVLTAAELPRLDIN